MAGANSLPIGVIHPGIRPGREWFSWDGAQGRPNAGVISVLPPDQPDAQAGDHSFTSGNKPAEENSAFFFTLDMLTEKATLLLFVRLNFWANHELFSKMGSSHYPP